MISYYVSMFQVREVVRNTTIAIGQVDTQTDIFLDIFIRANRKQPYILLRIHSEWGCRK